MKDYVTLHPKTNINKMRSKIVFLSLITTMNVSAQESENADTSYVYRKDLDGVTVVAHNEIRKMREAAMPVTVLGKRQLEGTTTSINDALARTAGMYWGNDSWKEQQQVLTMHLHEPLVLR